MKREVKTTADLEDEEDVIIAKQFGPDQLYFPTLQTVYDESKVKELSYMMDTIFEKVTESRTIASFKYQRKCYKRDRLVISKFVRKLNKRLSKYGLNKEQIETVKDVVRDTNFGHDEVKHTLLTSSTVYDDLVEHVIVPANRRKLINGVRYRINLDHQYTVMCVDGEWSYTVGVSVTSYHDIEFVIGVGPDSINGLLDEVVELVDKYDLVLLVLDKPFESKHLKAKDGTPLRYILRKLPNYTKAKDMHFYKNPFIDHGIISETAEVLYVEIGDSNNKLSHEEGWESFGAKTDFTLDKE